MAYDDSRGVVILFGGAGQLAFGDTWEWNGVHWTQVSTGGPSPRHAHAMTYDSARGVTVLFGGRGVYGELGDTWEWDGNNWELRSSTGPAPRWEHAMAYDSRRGVTVLYGGYGGAGQTWEWDGQVWLRKTTFFGPETRYAHTMAYDSTRGVTLLFSGLGPGAPNSELWEWDGMTWTLFSDSGPPGRLYAGMAFDSARAVTMLFGGAHNVRYQDTWELPSCPVDSDGDGVPDLDDECDSSDLRLTVIIDGCDSEVANHLFDDGCTMGDRIAACAEGARNHGAFVRCVAELTNTWARDEIITSRDKGFIQRCAARANLPQRNQERARSTKGLLISPVETLSHP